MAAGEGDWDFYPCQIDDAVASIVVDLQYEHDAQPPSTATTLFRVRVQMLEPEEHGMGSAAETVAFEPIEDALTARAAEAGLVYVARVRCAAWWDLAFYGSAEHRELFASIAELVGSRRTEVHRVADPAWSYYREFLLPDSERRQWMEDRRLTDHLAKLGDSLHTSRRVDHWAHFPDAAGRDQFVRTAREAGFGLERAADLDEGELPFAAQVFRDDPVELEHIHGVVVQLCELATKHGGDYDGWECPVESSS